MRKVFIIQKPKPGHNFDMGAVEKLGEVVFLLNAPPNMHDQARIKGDVARLRKAIRDSHPSDCFIAMGGAPISLMLFGAACAAEGREIQLGLFSRGMDGDGRRGGSGGSYRMIPVSMAA